MNVFRSEGFRSLSPRRVYFGWWVSIVSAVNMALGSDRIFRAAGVLTNAIEDEFGWSRVLISLAASIGRLGTTLFGPAEGWLVDTFGAGRMVLIGFAVGGTGLIVLSWINGPLMFSVAFILISVGFSLKGFVASLTATNAWMIRRRTLGMAIVVSGMGFSSLLIPVIVFGIGQFGWRTTVLVMGILAILVGPLIAWVLGKRPTSDQLATQAVRPDERRRKHIRESKHEFTLREALRTRAFWAISITHMLVSFSAGAILVHLLPHLAEDYGANLSLGVAAIVYSIGVAVAFLSEMVGGVIGDYWNKRILTLCLASIQGVSLIVLAVADSFVVAAVAAAVWGVGTGARTPILLAMRGEYFGRQHFGKILAFSNLPVGIGMILAPVFMGFIYDVQETYIWGFYGLAGVCGLASFTILFATRPMSPDLKRRLAERSTRQATRTQF